MVAIRVVNASAATHSNSARASERNSRSHQRSRSLGDDQAHALRAAAVAAVIARGGALRKWPTRGAAGVSNDSAGAAAGSSRGGSVSSSRGMSIPARRPHSGEFWASEACTGPPTCPPRAASLRAGGARRWPRKSGRIGAPGKTRSRTGGEPRSFGAAMDSTGVCGRVSGADAEGHPLQATSAKGDPCCER